MFDFFTKSEKPKKSKSSASATSKQGKKTALNFNQSSDSASNGIKVFKPRSFEDVAEVIDLLIMSKPAIVNLKEIKEGTAQRVLDILCGAVYALKGGLCELEPNIYVLTPDGVSLN